MQVEAPDEAETHDAFHGGITHNNLYRIFNETPRWALFNTLRLRQNGRHFTDDTFKCVSLNENIWIVISISLKFVPKGPINNIPALVQIMAWRRPGDKPLSEPMMVSLLTYICVTRLQWVNTLTPEQYGCHFLADIFKCYFFNANLRILIQISLEFVSKVPINDKLALFKVMAWCLTNDDPAYWCI